jgi:hypothetical protein
MSKSKPMQLGPAPEILPPGGMKQDDLKAELINEFGFDPKAVNTMRWIDLINEVGHQRHTRDSIAGLIKQTDAPLFIGMPDTKDYIFDGHAGASPSGAERWLTCTASVAASRAFLETLTPNQQAEFAKAGVAARQGTTAHAAAEVKARFILGEVDEDEVDAILTELTIMPETEGEAYDDEMAEYVNEYTDLVKQYHDAGHEVLIERRVSAVVPLMTVDADGDPEMYEVNGSGDFISLPTKEEPVLSVGDLKSGENIYVDVDSNPQVRIYGLGALSEIADPETGELPDIDHIEYIIIQPRMGGISTWTESVEELLAWRDEVLSPALTEVLGGQKSGAKFEPSELACKWCPARGGCAPLAESRMEAASEMFDEIVEAEYADGPGAFPETGAMTDERLGELYAQILGLTKLSEEMKAEVNRRLHRGNDVPGFHLVSYTPPRTWKEEAAEELKHSKVKGLWKEPTLVTPTQAIKVMGEKADEILDLINVPDKRPVAAPVNDRRKPWEGKPPEEMFDIEEEE